MANLLDLMSPEHRESALERYRERTADRGIDNKVSSQIYLLAEFGYYYGWQAVKDVRDCVITEEEMFVLLEGARKVYYNKLVEKSQVMTTAVATPLSKNSKKTYNEGMKQFIERSKL